MIGFATNASFLDANASDGLRKCLAEEFSDPYIFHLRGNQRTSGEQSRKEGGKIFGSGSRAPIAISLLVKNPHAKEHGCIRFHDIGDYLSREDKLAKIATYGSINGIAQTSWRAIAPNDRGDWLNQRDRSFDKYMVIGDKAGGTALFADYSYGPITHRDTWVYNFSRAALASNVASMLTFYNDERRRYQSAATDDDPIKFVIKDAKAIAWDDKFFRSVAAGKEITYSDRFIVKACYRPFTTLHFYFDRSCIWSAYRMPLIFPSAATDNIVIQINAKYSGNGFIALIAGAPPDIHCNGDSQCFPRYLYDEACTEEVESQSALFTSRAPATRTRRDAITDAGLTHFQSAYPGETITKEDLFYYVYGLLHSPDYRERYADNLSKNCRVYRA